MVLLSLVHVSSQESTLIKVPPCSRKVKTFTDLYTFLSMNINKPGPETTPTEETTTKLLVPLTPGKSPSRKTRRIDSVVSQSTRQQRTPSSRRRILLTTSRDDKENDDNILYSRLNIEDIIESKTTKVKVLILSPNRDVKVITPQDKITIGMVKNLALKNWKTATNAFMSRKDILPKLLEVLNRTVNREFKAYCKTDTLIKRRKPDELISFSNKLVAKEAEVYLPFWNACICGSCGEEIKSGQNAVNAIALTTATVARHRVQDLSVFHYRISTVLCHSGVSFDGAVRLNKLGICMSPQKMVNAQREMGKDHDAKLHLWKKKVQQNESACLLLQEMLTKQLLELAEDDMEVNRTVDIKEESFQQYKFYNKEVLSYYLSIVRPIQELSNECQSTEDVIKASLDVLKGQEIPYYK